MFLWTPLECPSTGCFCEVAQAGVAQPLNVISSVLFIIAGLVIMFMTPADRWRRVFGFGVVLSGLGSTILHTTLTTGGQYLDVAALMLTGATLLAWSLARTNRWTNRKILSVLLLVSVIGLALIPVWPDGRRAWFTIMIALAILLELLYQRPSRSRVTMIAVSGLIILMGVFLWHFDESTSLCARWPWFNGHAFWHLGAALGTVIYVRAIRGLPTDAARRYDT